MSDIPGLPAETRIMEMTVQVPYERCEAFERMLLDFFAGDSKHDKAIRASADDYKQGIASLKHLYKISQRDSGQCRYVARFLAGLYNGNRFPFDLTDFRCLDDELFEHCIAVLKMDARGPEQEVHCYFENGSQLWEKMISDWNLDAEAKASR